MKNEVFRRAKDIQSRIGFLEVLKSNIEHGSLISVGSTRLDDFMDIHNRISRHVKITIDNMLEDLIKEFESL